MTTKIRMLHFADTHIGVETHGGMDPITGTSRRVTDFLERFDEMIDHALDAQIDLAVFAGDAFKNNVPTPTIQREFAKRIRRLAQHVPTFLLTGNHDVPGMEAKASSLDIFDAIEAENVWIGRTPGSQVINTNKGAVFLAWMPYPMKNWLLSSQERRGRSLGEIESLLYQEVENRLGELVKKAEQHTMPRVLCGHFSVGGAVFGSERSLILGRDPHVPKQLLANKVWDYVALGHIHKHQDLNPGKRPSIVYSGSLERIDFGEERETKGFCLVELERKKTRYQFIPVQARNFLTIQVDAREASDPTEKVIDQIKSHDCTDSIVRIKVQTKSEGQDSLRVREITEAMRTAFRVMISQQKEQIPHRATESLSIESMNPTELLTQYFGEREYPSERIQSLLRKAGELFDAAD